MIGLADRVFTAEVIGEAVAAGAGLARACEEAGIDRRTYRRWTAGGSSEEELQRVSADARPEALRPPPSNRLSAEERAAVLATCHAPRFADLPPGQIVPRLADEGMYLASESSFYRLLHDADEQHERGRARRRSSATITSHEGHGPNELWSWDVTWLASPTRGVFFYLYLIMDVWSRKIVAHEVYESETGELAASLVTRAVLAERCRDSALVLHADNGGPQRSSTLRVKLEELGLRSSFSRARVSDDNAYSESLFRTTKYRPDFPTEGFASVETAREWVLGFVRWYNDEHRHSAINFVTPAERHRGDDVAVLAGRERVYDEAKARNPARWSGERRDWSRPGTVWLNPEKPHAPEPEKLQEAA